MKKMKIFEFLKEEKTLVFILIILSILTRFWYFGKPAEIVFDEVYFAKFTSDYFKGEYYFDIHPPLAKLILAGSSAIFNQKPPVVFDFKGIGTEYTGNFFKLTRGVVSLFGVFLVLAVYWLAKRLFIVKDKFILARPKLDDDEVENNAKWIAFLSGLFVIFDNAILTQSRFVLTDIFLLFFGILGVAVFLKSLSLNLWSKKYFLWTSLSAVLLSASFSVKWTGLLFSGVVGVILIWLALRDKKIKRFLSSLLIMFLVGVIFYILIFAIHLGILSYSGDGNDYMSSRFKATLIGSNENVGGMIEPLGFWGRFFELNKAMLISNAGLTAEHSYGSKWYSWPISERPIYYWNKAMDDGQLARIYLQSNPILWWLAGLSILYWLLWWIKELSLKILKNKNISQYFFPISIILLGYFANLSAYIFVSRVAFLYHYFPSLLFAIIGLGFLIWKYLRKWPALILFILIAIILSFVFFAPLSYGLPLSEEQFNLRIWFPLWQ